MVEGDLPVRAQRLVREWSEKYQEQLRQMWDTQNYQKLPGLDD